MQSRRKRARSSCQQLVYTVKQLKELTGITYEWQRQLSEDGISFQARVSQDYPQIEPKITIDTKIPNKSSVDVSKVILNGWRFIHRGEVDSSEEINTNNYELDVKKTQLVISPGIEVLFIQNGKIKGSMHVSKMTNNGFELPLDEKVTLIENQPFLVYLNDVGEALTATIQNGAVRIIDNRYNGIRMKFCRQEKRFSLLHKTSIESLKKIIESKYFLHDVELHSKNLAVSGGLTHDKQVFSPENWCGDQFPGVYFRVNFGQFGQHDNKLSLWEGGDITAANAEDEVWIELSGDLVDRGDFHFNGFDSDGRLLGSFANYNEYYGQRTYFADEFERMVVQNNHYGPNSYAKNEIIFHHKVPLKYIKNIITNHYATYEEIVQILKDNNLDHKIMVKELERLDQSYSFPMEFTTIPTYEPNYCSCVAQFPYWAYTKNHRSSILKPNIVSKRVILSCADGKVSPKIQQIYNHITEFFEKLVVFNIEQTPTQKKYLEILREINSFTSNKTTQEQKRYQLLIKQADLMDEHIYKYEVNQHQNLNYIQKLYQKINQHMQNTIYTKALAISIDKELQQDQEEAVVKRLRTSNARVKAF